LQEGCTLVDSRKKQQPLAAKKRADKMPTLTIRLTNDQEDKIKKEAEAFGYTKGSLVKSKLFKDNFTPRKVPRPDQKELAKIVAQLGKLGSNINQIAKALNSGKIPPNAELILGLKSAQIGLEKIGEDVKETLGIQE
jgi:hypothetical protein